MDISKIDETLGKFLAENYTLSASSSWRTGSTTREW